MKASTCVMVVGTLVSACGAVYPEITPLVKTPPPGRELEPPPSDLLFIAFAGAEIPATTRDGRKWDAMGGAAPDPFAILFVDDKEVVRTPVQSDTLKPTWPDQKLANYRIPAQASVRVEVWDSNTLTNHPVCVKKLSHLQDEAGSEPMEIVCDSGARVTLRVERAHARWGLGFRYELRTSQVVAVTKVMPNSPAERAGLKGGEEILEIQGKKTSTLDAEQVQSEINANASVGVELLVKDAAGQRKVKVQDGAIYPTVDDGISVQ